VRSSLASKALVAHQRQRDVWAVIGSLGLRSLSRTSRISSSWADHSPLLRFALGANLGRVWGEDTDCGAYVKEIGSQLIGLAAWRSRPSISPASSARLLTSAESTCGSAC
jgi:hypothetical protein